MKKLCALTLTIYCFFLSYAQQEFAPIGANWYMNEKVDHHYYGSGDPLIDYYIIESKGDTLIDSVVYRQVGDDFFHQDGDQVYYLKNGSLHLIYDFDVNVGDTLTFEMLGCDYTEVDAIIEVKVRVSAVDMIEIEGQLLKQVSCDWLTWDSVIDNYPYVYIEKMGSLRIAIEDYVYCQFGYPPLLPFLRCYQDDDITYQSPRFLDYGGTQCDQLVSTNGFSFEESIQIFPNPFTDEITVESSITGDVEFQLYNTLGKMVVSKRGSSPLRFELPELPSGYYVAILKDRNGRFFSVQPLIKN